MNWKLWSAVLVAMAVSPLAGGAAGETLRDAWSAALALNAEHAASRLDQTAAQLRCEAARAERLPTASVTGAYSLRSDERNFLFSNPLTPGATIVSPYRQQEAASANATIRAPIYTSGRLEAGVRAAEADCMHARHAVDASRLALLMDVGEAYLSVLQADRDVQVAERAARSLESLRAELAVHYEQQRVSRSDLLAAEVAAAAGEQKVLQARQELQSARYQYNHLLGRELTAPVAIEETSLPVLPHNLEELQQIACHGRPDLMQLLALRDKSAYESKQLRAATRPQVAGVGVFEYEENRYQTPQALATAGVVVEWDLFDAGRSRRQASASATHAAAVAKLADDMRSRVALQVLRAWDARTEATRRRDVAQRTLGHAEEQLRVARLRYDQGMGVASEVLKAEAARTRAACDYYGALYDLTRTQVRLRYATGLLDDPASLTPPSPVN